MKRMPSYNIKKLLCSAEGEAGVIRLLDKLRSRELEKEVQSNSYFCYTGELEEGDYLSYCRFLASINGKRVLRRLEDQDGKGYRVMGKIKRK